MNPKKQSPLPPAWIENTHDLAAWLTALGWAPETPLSVIIDHLLQGPPVDWKKCRKCRKIYSTTFFDSESRTRDGYRAMCKACRRKTHAAQGRRRRASRKAMKNPGDLKEIQKHRAAAGLNPLPLGPDSPKPGRPAIGSIQYEMETV